MTNKIPMLPQVLPFTNNPVAAIQEMYDNDDPAFSIYDSSNPYALINLTPPNITQHIMRQNVQDVLDMPDEEHLENIKGGNGNIVLNRLRISFWNEYQRVLRVGGHMSYHRIYAGICTMISFERIMLDPYMCGWILKKPIDYLMVIEEGLEVGLTRLRDMLNFPIWKEVKGKDGEIKKVPDLAVCTLLLKVVDKLDIRRHGAPTQKINMLTANVDVPIPGHPTNGASTSEQLERIERELRTLRSNQ